MTRKDFLRYSACAAAAAAWKWDGVAVTAGSDIIKHDAPPLNRRPYTGVDWANAFQIRTTTHGHCDNQSRLDAYLARGFEFLTISNYYPSVPFCPVEDIREFQFHVRQDFPVVVRGKRTDGPFDWNAIVSRWKDKLPEKQRKQFPFRLGRKLFKPLPPGILEAPNAEHHYFLDPVTRKEMIRLHINSPGSAFASGTFDKRNMFMSHKRGWCYGSGEPWTIAVDRMLAGLIDPLGGGVTINHPVWTKMDYDFPSKMLDYDSRVLGMEVIHGKTYNSESYWDYTLGTGRQCYGFFVPDWSLWRGCNVLLVKERTVEACLRAYRQGNFYGAIHGGKVKFTNISFDGRVLEATTDAPVRYELISAKGKIAEKTDTGFSFKVPDTAKGHVYFRLRAAATDDSGEILYSQPFMV